MKIKNCKYCGVVFNARLNKTFCCSDYRCIQKKNAEKYKNRYFIKQCCVCKKEFTGCKQIKICSDKCKDDFLKKTLIVQQSIECKKCGIIIGNRNKFTNIYGLNTINKIVRRECASCKELRFKEWSVKQRGENNSNWKIEKIQRKRKYKSKEEFAKFMSEFNPMKRQEIKDKVSTTIKNKYNTGEILRPIGKLSILWKGNRKRSFTIRTRLNWWRKDNLRRANYKCEICQSKKKLEVHHPNNPFRVILAKVLGNRILEDLSDAEFETVCLEINEIHKSEPGLVVCKICHSQIDTYRKI